MIETLLTVIVVVAVVGVFLWLVTTYIPMPEPLGRVLIVVVALVLFIWAVRVLLAGGALRGL